MKDLKVLIIGKPNVGKSTLFNRLVGKRKALVHNLAGVTRDLIEDKIEFNKKNQAPLRLQLCDTGGIGEGLFSKEIKEIVNTSLETAALVLVVFDIKTPLSSEDKDLVAWLRKKNYNWNQVIPILNKCDTDGNLKNLSEFYQLGFKNFQTVSAEHNRGIEDLKEEIFKKTSSLRPNQEETLEPDLTKNRSLPKIAIVGKPNVGKSTLLNALARAPRMITSNIAGTTTDAVDTLVTLGSHKMLLIDTAGIRKKSKTEQGLEVLSVVLAKKALDRADCALLVLNGEEGPVEQDLKITALLEDAGCAVIILVNKWDLMRTKYPEKKAIEFIHAKMGHLKWAPILFVSALKRTGYKKLADLIMSLLNKRDLKINTHELTELIKKEAEIHNPKNAKFYYSFQVSSHPPSFVCHVNDPEKIHFSLKRHLVHAIRDRWDLYGWPIRLKFLKAKNSS